MGKEIQVRIVLRHNTTAGWAEVEEKEVLRKGEIGLEFSQSSNIPKMKIGDGIRPWNGLPYFSANLPETFNWGLLKGTLFEGETEKIEEGSFAGLTKPAYKDNADISVINKNFDILKTNIEELQNKTSSIESTISDIDEAKVDKVSGKGLSTNDYTTDEKNKLAGIATGATKVIVDSALSSTSTNAIQNKVVANMKNEIDNALEEKLDINGNAVTATKATQDGAGQQINTTYIKGLSINGKTITYTKGDGTTGTITTQDTNTTYSAGAGLSLSGTTFNHSNSITAATAQGDASKTLAFNDTFTIPTITYDAQGHITGKGTTTMTMPVGPVAKEGNPVSEIGIAGAGFSAETIFEPKQEGSGDPSPDNIRPISGWTGATLTRCGKNLLPPAVEKTIVNNGVTFTSDGQGRYTINGTATGANVTAMIDLAEPITIGEIAPYCHLLNPVANPNISFSFIRPDGTQITWFTTSSVNRIRQIQELAGETISKINLYLGKDKTADNFTLTPMFCIDDVPAVFAPYQGDTYAADFGQTVYGGTLDWLTGVLTVEWASVQFMPTEIAAYGSAGYSMLSANNLQPIAALSDFYSVCDRFKRNYVWQTDAEYYYVTNDFVFLFSNRWTTLEEAKTWFTDNPTIMVYKLATPTTIQLTPYDLRMLDGINNVYSNGTTNYVIFNSGASSLGKAYELFFKKTDTIPVSNGGTGATSASGARTNLEVPSRTGDGASGTWGISVSGNAATATLASYVLKMQTYKQGSTTETYGTSYPLYAQWESSNVLKLKCDNYTVKTDTATKLATARTLTIGNTGKIFDGSGNVSWSLSEIGAAAASHGTHVTNSTVQVFNRDTIGTSPNFDNPGVNGFFEVRLTSETSGETGTKPFNSFGTFLNLRTPDHIAMLQLAAPTGGELMFRAKQAAGVTMSGVAWKTLLSSSNYNSYSPTLTGIGASGTWGINITGNAVTANKLAPQNTATSCNNPGVYCISSAGSAVGNTTDYSADTPNLYTSVQYGTILRLKYNNSTVYYTDIYNDANQNALYFKTVTNGASKGWVRILDSSNYTSYTVTKTGSGASGTWGISISGNAATATQLATARTIQTNLGSTSSASFNGTANTTPGVTGTLAIANGGTGATSKSGARTNLGITSGTTLPSSGSSGDIFFLY